MTALRPVWEFCKPDIVSGFRENLAAGFFIQPRRAMKLSWGDKILVYFITYVFYGLYNGLSVTYIIHCRSYT